MIVDAARRKELEKIALDAGLPEGVLNVVAGPGSVCGQRLVEHPDVAKIAFTGSTEVGRGIAEGAAGTIKRVTLELGGKSANVIYADADLAAAAATSGHAGIVVDRGPDDGRLARLCLISKAYTTRKMITAATNEMAVASHRLDNSIPSLIGSVAIGWTPTNPIQAR